MSVRSKSKRRLLILVAGVLTLCLAAGSFYVYRKARIRQEFARLRAEGLAAAQANDHPRVVDRLGQYLRRDPSDEAVLVEYAKSRLLVPAPQNQHKVQAVMVLRHLVGLYPQRIDELRTLLSLYAETGYVTETIGAADMVLKRFPNDAQAMDFKARALLRLRQYDEALAAAQKCLEIDPERAGVALVAVDAMRQNATPAAQITETAKTWKLWDRPGDGRSELVRGYVSLQTGDREAAVGMLRAAASRQWTDVENGKVLVGLLERLAPSERPDPKVTAIPLADLSLSLLEQLSKTAPGDRTVREALARRYWEAGRAQDVVQLLGSGAEAADHAALDSETLGLHATALIQLQRAAEAGRIREALASRADDPESAAWAAILRQGEAGAPDARRLAELCQAALDRNPESAYLRYFLGTAYKQLGEDAQAHTAWTEAAQRGTTWATPLVRLADSHLAAGRYDAAFGAARAAVFRARNDAGANLTFLRVAAECVSRGTFDAADQAATRSALLADLRQVQQQFPGEEHTLLGQISLLARSADDAERRKAAELITQAADSDAKPSEQALLRLAAVSRAAKLGVEEKCYARAEKEYGLTPALAYARAADRFAGGDTAGGLNVIDEAAARAAAKDRPSFEVARLRYLDLTGDPGAPAAAAALADARPQDLQVQQTLLQLRTVAADRGLLDRTIQRVRSLAGEQALNWRVARARWLMTFSPDAGLKEATTLLTEVVRRAPDSAEARLLLGRALRRAGDLAGATDQLTAAAELDPSSVPARLELVAVLQARGEQARAAQHLDKVTGGLATRASAEERRRAAMLLSLQGRTDQAVELLEPHAAGDRPSALLLADLYRSAGRKEQLAVAVEKLLQEPDAATIAFAADLYASQGRQAEAQAVLGRLDQLQLVAGEKQLIRADHVARYGSLEEACQLYEAAAKEMPRDARAWRALVSSRIALGRATEALAAADEALRQIPDDPAFMAVRQNGPLLQATAANPRLNPLAVLFTRDPSANVAAADLLRTLSDEQKGTASAQQVNARLSQIASSAPQLTLLQAVVADRYLAAGRFDDAAAAAARAVQASPSSSEALRLQSTVLAASGRWSEALQAALHWRERSGNAPLEADIAISDAYLATGQPDQAMRQLEPYAGMLNSGAATQPADSFQQRLIPAYARALEGLGRTDDAARIMEPLLKADAGWRQGWLLFAVRSLPEGRAAEWIQRVADLSPDSVQDQTVVAEVWGMLAARTKNTSYADKAREILGRLAAQPNAAAVALASMGMRYEQDGRVKEAEATYRRALAAAAADTKSDPRQSVTPVIQNNLAMLLARSGSNLDEATTLATAAVKSNPNAATLHDTLAFVHAKAGRYADAVASERVAVRLDPGDPSYQISLARFLVSNGQADNATQVLNELEARYVARPERLAADLRGQIQEVRDLIAKSAMIGQNRASAH